MLCFQKLYLLFVSVYYELGGSNTATATLSFTISSVTLVASNTRSFEIKVSQIECTSRTRPPSGCFQYHTGLTGTIKTFNYDATSAATRVHLATQRYSICIRQEEGMCCNQYSLCDYTAKAAAIATDSWSLHSAGTGAINADTGTNCIADHIQIDGAQLTCNSGYGVHVASKICGLIFGAQNVAMMTVHSESICDCSAPFSIDIYTDSIAETDTATTRRGLCLDYQMIPC